MGCDELREGVEQSLGEVGLSLDSNLDGLEGAQRNVRDDLRRRGGSQVDQRLLQLRLLLMMILIMMILMMILMMIRFSAGILVLEVLVEAVFAGALRAVAQQRRRPAPEESPHALLPKQYAESASDAPVLGRIRLRQQIHDYLASMISSSEHLLARFCRSILA